jgi:hypothetical protein
MIVFNIDSVYNNCGNIPFAITFGKIKSSYKETTYDRCLYPHATECDRPS